MKKKKQTSKMLTEIEKAGKILLISGTLITSNVQESKGQWFGITYGATNPLVQKIGIGNFPTNASVLAKLHINQFLLAPNPPTNGLLFRTDGNSTQDNMWQFFTGTSATNQTEKFRLFIPANSNDVFLRATNGQLILQDTVNQITLAEIVALKNKVEELKKQLLTQKKAVR